jgi:hypothetical protein
VTVSGSADAGVTPAAAISAKAKVTVFIMVVPLD